MTNDNDDDSDADDGISMTLLAKSLALHSGARLLSTLISLLAPSTPTSTLLASTVDSNVERSDHTYIYGFSVFPRGFSHVIQKTFSPYIYK